MKPFVFFAGLAVLFSTGCDDSATPGTGGGSQSSTTTNTSTSSSTGSGGVCGAAGPETCANTADEDNNGAECAEWSHLYGDAAQQTALRPALSATGEVYFTGHLGSGAVTFAGQTYADQAGLHSVLGKLGPAGEEQWMKLLPSALMVAARPTGGVVVGVFLQGPFDFGGGSLAGQFAVVAYDANGNHVWSRAFTATGMLSVERIAVGPDGGVVLSGEFSKSLDAGGLVLQASTNDLEVALLKLDGSTGAPQWGKAFTSNSGARSAIAPDGTILLAGYVSTSIDLGGGPIQGYGSAFLARFSSAGAHLSSMQYCTTCQVQEIAADSDGAAILTGILSTPSTFDPALEPVTPTSVDAFIGKVTPINTYAYTSLLSGPAIESAHSVTSTCGGDVVATFTLTGPVSIGGEVVSSGLGGATVVKLDASGVPVWHRDIDHGGNCQIAGASTGEVALACSAVGPVDYGAGTLQGDGTSNDIAIVKLAP